MSSGHHHGLLATESRPNAQCDICKEQVGGSAWYCKECDYDECNACFTHVSSSTWRSLDGHEHLLTLTRVNNYYCDLCRRGGLDLTWQCQECRYDECMECFSVSKSRKKLEQNSNHPHALRHLHNSPAWRVSCDVCSRQNIASSYKCTLCCYDECLQCFATSTSKVMMLGHNHQLSLKEGSRICNLCRATTNLVWQCAFCDYDECFTCFASSYSEPKVEKAVATKATKLNEPCETHTMGVVLSTKHLHCDECRGQHDNQTPRWTCDDCNLTLCLNCRESSSKSMVVRLDVRAMVLLENFNGISDRKENQRDQVIEILESNQQEIETMNQVIDSAKQKHDAEWDDLNNTKMGLEEDARAIQQQITALTMELEQTTANLDNIENEMSGVLESMEQADTARAFEEERANSKRGAHWLWCGATLVAAAVFPPAALLTAGNAIGTHHHLKKYEKNEQGYINEYNDLVEVHNYLQEEKANLETRMQAVEEERIRGEAVLSNIGTFMEAIRQQSYSLENFKADMLLMQTSIEKLLITFKQVVTSVNHNVDVSRALLSVVNDADAHLAIAFEGIENIEPQSLCVYDADAF